MQVQGPFYAPAGTAVKSLTKRTMLVASGIGITPFFSVMATRVADEANYQADKDVYTSLFNESLSSRGQSTSTIKGIKQLAMNRSYSMTGMQVEMLHVIWTIREVSELMFYLDYVYELVKQQNSLAKPTVMVEVYLTGIGKKTDLTYMMTQTLFLLTMASKTSQYMKVHFLRPDMNAILDSVHPDKVYYCGGKVLKDMLSDVCIEKNVPFHPEDFDSGTTFVKETKAFFSKIFRDKQSKKREIFEKKKSMRSIQRSSTLEMGNNSKV
jgi:hypothetical protein